MKNIDFIYGEWGSFVDGTEIKRLIIDEDNFSIDNQTFKMSLNIIGEFLFLNSVYFVRNISKGSIILGKNSSDNLPINIVQTNDFEIKLVKQ